MISLIQQATPSYGEGFAKISGESASPDLWDGLIGICAPFLGNTGASVKNIVDRNFIFTLTNSVWASSNIGAVVDFTADTNKLTMGGFPFIKGFNLFSPCTYIVIIKPRTLGQTTTSSKLIGFGDGTKADGFSLQASNALQYFSETTPTGQMTAKTATGIFNLNEWNVFAVTFPAALSLAAADIHIFCNGKRFPNSATETDGAGANPTTAFDRGAIGANDFKNNRTVDGTIALALIYNKVLSDSQIKQHSDDWWGFLRLSQFIPTTPPVGIDIRKHIISSYMRINN